MQGGFMFWTIVLLGVAAIVSFIERWMHLHAARIRPDDFLKGVCNVLDKRNVDEALLLCEETPGPVAAVTAVAIAHRDDDGTARRDAVLNAERSELSKLERRLTLFSVTCEIAPLCGLFGTLLGVYGIVGALRANAPAVITADFTTGLSAILSCVLAGILVSIECHVMYAVLMSRIERLVIDMEAAGAEMLSYLSGNLSTRKDE